MTSRRRSHAVELGVLTGAKVVSNAALRWVGPFLPTLSRAFDASTGTLTGVMGVAELGGLSTLATGGRLDRGHERRLFLLGTAAVSVSSLIALGGSAATFALAYLVLSVGVNNLTVAGHAWIGHRVPFTARGRAIGTFETSWAISLLVGAPILAVLIRVFGWRGPYLALALAGAAATLVVRAVVAPSPPPPVAAGPALDGPRPRPRLPRTAFPPMLAAAMTAATGLGVVVVSGAWLDDAHGVSTTGLGLVAAGFGAVELISSSAVAMVSDRIGPRRSVVTGLVVAGAGLATIASSGETRALAIAGLIVFLGGFEYAFVAALALVTEAAPEARGRAIGAGNAIGTVARAGAVVTSGQLYEAFGITGSLWLATATATAAVALTVLGPR